jgi:hypothetical protein
MAKQLTTIERDALSRELKSARSSWLREIEYSIPTGYHQTTIEAIETHNRIRNRWEYYSAIAHRLGVTPV